MGTRTAGDVLASADFTLSDASRVRYTEPERLGFVRDALNALRNGRPDLFLGAFGTNIAALTLASVLPVDDQFFRPIVDYVIARCETKDDEFVENGRVAVMAGLAKDFLS